MPAKLPPCLIDLIPISSKIFAPDSNTGRFWYLPQAPGDMYTKSMLMRPPALTSSSLNSPAQRMTLVQAAQASQDALAKKQEEWSAEKRDWTKKQPEWSAEKSDWAKKQA